MKRSLSRWQWAGFIFTGIAGILLHFAYDWSGQSSLLAPFAGVNESSWEHMKLLFYPMSIFALSESRFLKEHYPEFWCVKLYGIAFGLALIPLIFYTFNGAFGPSPDWYNIAIYFQAAAAAYLLETHLLNQGTTPCISPKVALAVLLLIAIAFAVFTWFPPKIPLFQDPTTGLHGIMP